VAIVELKNITRSYRLARAKEDLKILKGIDLTIEEGEFVAIMGPSGSGKSTLMQIMGILDRPTSGIVTVWRGGTCRVCRTTKARRFGPKPLGLFFRCSTSWPVPAPWTTSCFP
jgi:ABC-type lipoprotein export system ATPase subunit